MQCCLCPAHSKFPGTFHVPTPKGHEASFSSTLAQNEEKEYAFEIASSNIRYGEGVTREVGLDVQNLGVKHLCVMTDKNVGRLPPLRAVLDSLHTSGVHYTLFDDVCIEPTNESFEAAISFARSNTFDGFLAVGGGSVMDTAKIANLFSCYPENEFLDFVAPPVGKGVPIDIPLNPLICVPTTNGTSSENTGVAVFDHKPLKVKLGFIHRGLRPRLGIVDPLHLQYMPKNVAAFNGFDMLCHALESFTTLPYTERIPCPTNPADRPAYQGRNPVSDVWARQTLVMMRKYFKRAVYNADDNQAQRAMHLANVYSGLGVGNAGVHLPHAMAYPIAGLVKSFKPEGYCSDKPLIPHGLSVVMTAPATFEFTSPICPQTP